MPIANISEDRRAVSRANGAKSGASINPQGKTISSKNDVRHRGLTIRALTLPAECPDAAAELLAAYAFDLNPNGPVEHDIVEMLAVYKWQMFRVESMQRGFLVNTETRHAAFIKDHLDDADPGSFAAENFRHANLEGDTFSLLARYASELRLVQRPRVKGFTGNKRQIEERTRADHPSSCKHRASGSAKF